DGGAAGDHQCGAGCTGAARCHPYRHAGDTGTSLACHPGGGVTAEPDWLVWPREIQATAQTGLHFTSDPYDRDRYAALLRLAARVMAAHTSAEAARIEALFFA